MRASTALSLGLCAAGSFFFGACGARTISDDYRSPDAAVAGDVGGDGALPPVDVPQGPCGAGLAFCGGRCVDPRSDNNHCGACGIFCGRGTRCELGRCAGGCPDGRALCGSECVDIATDIRHCGSCGRQCLAGVPCALGACQTVCSPGQTRCGETCTDLLSDGSNCGACFRRCPENTRCAMGGCEMLPPLVGGELRVDGLGVMRCASLEHASLSGDDRGGIAALARGVAYSGDSFTAGFGENLVGPVVRMATLDTIFSDLARGDLYALGQGGAPLRRVTEGTPWEIDSLVRLNGSVVPNTGVDFGEPLTTVRLGTPVRLSSTAMQPVGIYAGVGRVVLTDDRQLYDIDLATGAVRSQPFTSILPRQRCETWATWGVAEFFEGTLHLVYVESPRRVARYNTRTGAITTVATFQNLSDMCSITVAPWRQRWYFHHEGTSQFTQPGTSADESIGFCEASIRVAAPR